MLSGPARPRPAHVLSPSRVALGVVLLEALLDLALGLLTRPAVALLKRAGELAPGAVDPVQIVVGESTHARACAAPTISGPFSPGSARTITRGVDGGGPLLLLPVLEWPPP